MSSRFQSRSLHTEGHSIARKRPVKYNAISNVKARFSGAFKGKSGADWWRYFKRGVLAMAALLVLYLAYLWFTLPDISDPTSFLASESTVITDRNGTELYRVFAEENRTFIDDTLIPDHMKQAIIAIEDQRFYERGCLDVIALGRAVVYMGKAGGASTLTRQLARNALSLHGENVLNRKLKELALGCQIESRYSKDEVLGLYLNWIPFGQNAYGIEQASKVYFGKSAQELSLAQSAILASLPQRPTYFSPYGKNVYTSVSDTVAEQIADGKITSVEQIPDESVRVGLIGNTVGSGSNVLYIGGRSNQVLKNMEDQGLITAEERQIALDELQTMEFESSRESIRAAHFVLWVREQVEELLGETSEQYLERGGLTVTTTLDWELQEIAETIVNEQKDSVLERFGAHNTSLLSADPVTGDIMAYVGNMDYNDTEHGGKIDMIQVPRQPGSSFKPFVYLAAFANGYSPATVLYDVPTRIGADRPQNFDADFMGPMSIRQALGASRNIPAAKAYFLGGEQEEILELTSELGASTPLNVWNERVAADPEFEYGWPLALGAAETPMTEMVQMYSTLANNGERIALRSILSITDKDGNILYEAEEPEAEEVIDPRLAYQVTSILSDPEARPAGYWRSQLSVGGYETAAKTGTSNKCLEYTNLGACRLRKPDNAWVLGFTPNLVTGVWIGNADNSAMFDQAGGLNSASPIWKEFMTRSHNTLEETTSTLTRPSGLATPQISTLSGLLPADCTPVDNRRDDVFLNESVPTETDNACTLVLVDRVTGLLASDTCPAEAQEERAFFVPSSILPERWPFWEQGVQEWAAEEAKLWDLELETPGSGSLLPLPPIPTQACDPALTPGRLNKPQVQIEAPLSTATYPAFTVKLNINSVSEIREIRHEIDGKLVLTEDRPPFRGIVRVPQSISRTGKHTLKVTIIDEYYNQASDEREFSFGTDTSNPEIQITVPRDQSVFNVGDTITMRATATDSEGGIKYVQWYLDDTLLSTRPLSPYELEYTITDAPGVYDLKAIAEDYAEHTAADRVRITVLEEGGQVQQSDTPALLSPAVDTNMSVRETLPITIVLPRFGFSAGETVRLEVGNNGQYETLFSLNQSNGGVQSKEWNPDSTGTYTLRLRSEYSSGTEEIWDSVQITVR